jgi:hypothetical protein
MWLLLLLAGWVLSACRHGQHDFADIGTGWPQPIGPEGITCKAHAPGLAPDPGDLPAGVPFPTPVGARAKPGITGIPLPPGSVEVDGFNATRAPGPRGGSHAVQVFDVPMAAADVLAFFDGVFRAHNWSLAGSGTGPDGTECTFVPFRTVGPLGSQADWVVVSTAYIPRDKDRDVHPPPGFRGKAVPFAPANPGKTRFWIVTPKP